MIPKIHIIRTSDGVDFPLPSYPSKHHVGLVLYAAIPTVLKLNPHERAFVPVGFGIGIPDGLCGQIVSLPEIARKSGIIVLDAPQIVNPADRGSLFVLIQNATNTQHVLRRGDAIAQLLITQVYQIAWDEITGKTLHSGISEEQFIFNDDSTPSNDENKQQSQEENKRAVKSVRERTKAADRV